MARTHDTLPSLFSDMADAIRSKTGKSDKIIADNFPTEINSIVMGSGDATDGDVLAGKTYSNDDGASTGTMADYHAEYEIKVTYPVKGDLIIMDLGTTAAAGTNNLYRVLKIDDSQAEVVAMFDYNTSIKFNSSSVTTTIGSLTCQQYNNSNVDTTLNTTFYGAMNDIAKAAIVVQDVKQDV